MRRFYSVPSFALAVLVIVGISHPVRAGDQVPFMGGLGGLVSHTPVDDQTDYVVVEATGTATQLGHFAVSAPHFVDLATRTAAGYYEFTAANGDKVHGEFTGQATPTSTPGVISIVESVTITGGTGRFAGASGSFTVERLFDRIAGTTIGSFKGTISAP